MVTKHEDLKKLAAVAQYYFHAYGMICKGEHGDDGDHVYWARYSDIEHLPKAITALQQEVENLKYHYELAMSDWKTALQQAAQARQEALEQAAKVCESHAFEINGEVYGTWSKECADAIRALKRWYAVKDWETKP